MSLKIKIIVGAIILIILAGAPSVYFYRQYQKAQLRLNNPSEAAKEDAQATINAVAKLILLPPGEEPTVLQVTDVSRLKDQPFFANAQNGDKVLIFQQAKKAILYRSSTNQIIDVAPVNLDNTATTSATTVPPESAVDTFSEIPTPATNEAIMEQNP